MNSNCETTEVQGASFVEAYSNAVKLWFQHRPQSMTVQVTGPISKSESIPKKRVSTLDVWREALNLGDQFTDIENISLGKESEKTGSDTVGDWVEDRIIEQLEDTYWERSSEGIEEIIDKLQNGYQGNTLNALIVNLFNEDDRQRAMAAPLVPGLPCVTHLQFTTDAGTLSLFITLRSQWLGLKGLGNLVAGGALLAFVAQRADYEVGMVQEEIHNVTTHDSGDDIEEIAQTLTSM